MLKLALIALGGGVGAVGRYAIGGFVQRFTGADFPWGTMAVNLLGCAMIGVIGGYLLAGPHPVRDEYRAFLFIGLLGAFTTFSTFGWETVELLNDGEWSRALLNVALSNVVGLGAVWLGLRAAERFAGV